MSTTIDFFYQGDGLTTLIHGPTHKQLITDLPPDNGGKGREFSPTDLLVCSLGSCILTIMGEMAKRKALPFEGTTLSLSKEMGTNPRRITKIAGTFHFNPKLTQADQDHLKNAIKACPVHQSLHPELIVELN